MIYNENEEYSIRYYKNLKTGRFPVVDYIDSLSDDEQAKVLKYMNYLKISRGYLDEPYSRHISGKIRELRVDFAKNRHRIFYFTFVNKRIIMLHAFLKKTAKTPQGEIDKAIKYYNEIINSHYLYE